MVNDLDYPGSQFKYPNTTRGSSEKYIYIEERTLENARTIQNKKDFKDNMMVFKEVKATDNTVDTLIRSNYIVYNCVSVCNKLHNVSL